jgi:hypothetical protein
MRCGTDKCEVLVEQYSGKLKVGKVMGGGKGANNMVINVSQVNEWLGCQAYWKHRNVSKRGVEPTEGSALSLGTRWHQLVAGEAQLHNPEDSFQDPYWMRAGLDAWHLWVQEHPGIEILEREVVYQRSLDEHVLIGTLDALVRWGGALWHLQHKSLTPGVPISVFAQLQARSLHEHGYKYLVGPEYRGTILVICRKLTKGDPLCVEYIKPKGDHARMLATISATATRMERVIRGEAQAIENPNACAGPYRNHLCEYIGVCNGDVDITSLPERGPSRYELQEAP